MGIASLILGIISGIVGIIPFCGILAIIPAIIGLILGIIFVVKKSKIKEPKGIGIAGIILSTLALVFIVLWNLIFVGIMAAATEEDTLTNLDTYDYDDNFDYDYDDNFDYDFDDNFDYDFDV